MALSRTALSALRRWYREHGRHDLPWRLTRDPYAVLVSEVMLQQTQVGRVLPSYERWLVAWPDFAALAGASPAEVLRMWAGLGYNRRALALHRLAVAVVAAGGLAEGIAGLRRLPGVGPYTAAAVSSFARERPVAAVDTNIGRVLARAVAGVAEAKGTAARTIDEAARALLPGAGKAARHHNLALMDLGATICTARAPRCAACPLRRDCAWTAAGYPPSTVPPGRRAQRFEETARFARGRIIDALRKEDGLSRSVIAHRLHERHQAGVDGYLEALLGEGLVEVADGLWSLAGTQGSRSMASPKL